MQRKEVITIAVVLLGVVLLFGSSFTGFQVYRLFSPSGQQYPTSAGYFEENCVFYSGYYMEAERACQRCMFNAIDVVNTAFINERSIRNLQISACTIENEGNIFFARGYVSATIG